VTNKQSRAINRLRKRGVKLSAQDELEVKAWQKLHDELWPRPNTAMFLGPMVRPGVDYIEEQERMTEADWSTLVERLAKAQEAIQRIAENRKFATPEQDRLSYFEKKKEDE